MTRRLALLTLGAFAHTATPDTLGTPQRFTAPAHLTIDLNNWDAWTITHRGKELTITSDDIFAALSEKSA